MHLPLGWPVAVKFAFWWNQLTLAMDRPLIRSAKSHRHIRIAKQSHCRSIWRLGHANLSAPTSDTAYLTDNVFTAVHAPALQLAIVGAVHITQVLAPIARMAGYSVFLIDPREGFATQTRYSR